MQPDRRELDTFYAELESLSQLEADRKVLDLAEAESLSELELYILATWSPESFKALVEKIGFDHGKIQEVYDLHNSLGGLIRAKLWDKAQIQTKKELFSKRAAPPAYVSGKPRAFGLRMQQLSDALAAISPDTPVMFRADSKYAAQNVGRALVEARGRFRRRDKNIQAGIQGIYDRMRFSTEELEDGSWATVIRLDPSLD